MKTVRLDAQARRFHWSMVLGPISGLAVAACVTTGGHRATSRICSINTLPRELGEHEGQRLSGRHLAKVWDVPGDTPWDSPGNPNTTGFLKFRAEIAAGGGTDLQTHSLNKTVDYNGNLVAMNSREMVKPASCLEQAVYGDFLLTSENRPASGFDGYVLRNPASGAIRAYYELIPQDDVATPDLVDTAAAADLRAGWNLLFELHAHSPKGGSMRQRTVAPSISDAANQLRLSRQIGLQAARITDGMTTVRMPSSLFPFLQSDR